MENENKKLVSVTVPKKFVDEKDYGFITAGKTYDVHNYEGSSSFYIIDDKSKVANAFCLKKRCAYLNGLDWILNYE